MIATVNTLSRPLRQLGLIPQIAIGIVCGILLAALVAVVASFAFPTTLALDAPQASGNPPGGIIEILQNLLLSAVSNPVRALMEANFIAILAWAIGLGIMLRGAAESTRTALNDLSGAVSQIVRVVIRLAPLGIFGLVAGTLAEAGMGALLDYGHLLLVIVGCMLFVALVTNPLIVFWKTRATPIRWSSPACAAAPSPPSSRAVPPPTSRSTSSCASA